MSDITWEGDLEGDCTAKWQGYSAHAEAMDEDSWYCSVCRLVAGAARASDNVLLFHSSENDTVPLTGDAARKLCEYVMRADHGRREAASYQELAALADKARDGLTVLIQLQGTEVWVTGPMEKTEEEIARVIGEVVASMVVAMGFRKGES